MQVLPLVMALAVLLTVLTVGKLELYTHQMILKREYQTFLNEVAGKYLNEHQQKRYDTTPGGGRDLRQLTFRPLLDRNFRDRDASATRQFRILQAALLKIVYGEAAFFKEMVRRRPHCVEELLDAIERAADRAPKGMIQSIGDMAKLELDDRELQQFCYKMLKGTVRRERIQQRREQLAEGKELTAWCDERAYPSLFTFINYEGSHGKKPIELQLCPREILKAIFIDDQVVEEVIAMREKLSQEGGDGASFAFREAFLSKRREGIDDQLLSFNITTTDKRGNR